jgi:hypothetical protein
MLVHSNAYVYFYTTGFFRAVYLHVQRRNSQVNYPSNRSYQYDTLDQNDFTDIFGYMGKKRLIIYCNQVKQPY